MTYKTATVSASTMKRLKPADVGFSGKGVPDAATLSRLQSAYAKKVIRSGSLPPEIFDVYVRMNKSMGTGFRPPREGMELAKRLLPYLYFDVNESIGNQPRE